MVARLIEIIRANFSHTLLKSVEGGSSKSRAPFLVMLLDHQIGVEDQRIAEIPGWAWFHLNKTKSRKRANAILPCSDSPLSRESSVKRMFLLLIQGEEALIVCATPEFEIRRRQRFPLG